MSPIEIAAFALGVANVTLLVRRSLWNYPVGLAMVTLYAWVFLTAKLYSDALLQLFFFAVQLYGWLNWARNKAQAGEVRVVRLGLVERSLWAAGIIAATLGWGWAMHRFTDAALPWWDAAVAMTSVAAQVLLSRRAIENWWLWIAVDAMAIGLYATKDLWLTAVLYVIFLVLSAWGLINWRRVAARA